MTSTHEDMGSILGPAQQVKDPALQQATVQVKDMAQISGVAVAVAQAGSCSSNSTLILGTSICLGVSLKKRQEKKLWLFWERNQNARGESLIFPLCTLQNLSKVFYVSPSQQNKRLIFLNKFMSRIRNVQLRHRFNRIY